MAVASAAASALVVMVVAIEEQAILLAKLGVLFVGAATAGEGVI